MTRKEIERYAKNLALESIKNFKGYYNENGDRDEPYLAQLIGSVMSLTPSGKYYLPFACSHVEPCPRCNGSGLSKKIHDCEICFGTGERLLEEMVQFWGTKENFVSRQDGRLLLLDSDTFECWGCWGHGYVHETCSYCEGLGSREAHEDEIFWDVFEKILSKHGFWCESGEGNPLDVFVCRSFTEEELSELEA